MTAIKEQLGKICGRAAKDIKDYYIAIILFIAYNIIVRKIFHAFCPFWIITGFPCAGCGMTRAVFYLLTGRFSRAMNLNPAALLWLAFIIWFFYMRYVKGKTPRRAMMWLGIVCAATLAIYMYRMIIYFPSYPPLVYNRRNLMLRFIGLLQGK